MTWFIAAVFTVFGALSEATQASGDGRGEAALLRAFTQAQELAPAPGTTVDLRVNYSSLGSWIEVQDPSLGIRLNSRVLTNGRMNFYGRAGDKKISFESEPLSGSDPNWGHVLRSAEVMVQVRRFGEGFLLDGRVGSRPVSLQVSRERFDNYAVTDRGFGRVLEAWVPSSFAQFRGKFDPEKIDRETLAVLGAAAGLMFRSARGASAP